MKIPEILPVSPQAIERCAAVLRAGEVVAFPTETVYGLGCDATQDKAVAKVFEAKGRPQFNPLIVHVLNITEAEKWVEMDDRAYTLAEAFWPGALTLVLPRKKSSLSLLVSAGLDTVAIRVPAHPVARDLLAATQRPIAAPSANRSGAVSPTNPLHVFESLEGRIPLVLADGRTPIGLESTVLDLTADAPTILRPGSVLPEDIEALVGPLRHPRLDRGSYLVKETLDPRSGAGMTKGQRKTYKSPGQLESHYAPTCPVRLNATSVHSDEALLAFGPEFVTGKPAEKLNLSEKGDLVEAAANLFGMLRLLDKPIYKCIAVMPIPEVGLGVAINDRLRRAAI